MSDERNVTASFQKLHLNILLPLELKCVSPAFIIGFEHPCSNNCSEECKKKFKKSSQLSQEGDAIKFSSQPISGLVPKEHNGPVWQWKSRSINKLASSTRSRFPGFSSNLTLEEQAHLFYIIGFRKDYLFHIIGFLEADLFHMIRFLEAHLFYITGIFKIHLLHITVCLGLVKQCN